jgi:lipid A ethanolaminephosphotransferase
MRLSNFKFITNYKISVSSLTLLTALFIILFDNQLFWHTLAARLDLSNTAHWQFILMLGVILVLLFHSLLTLMAFKPLIKPLLATVLILAAGISYFSDSFGVIIDKSMIHNILETDIREASELLTWPLLWHLLLYGVLPASLLVMIPIRYPSWRRGLLLRSTNILLSLVIATSLCMIDYKELVLFGRANKDLRMFINPTYPIYSLNKVLRKKYFASAEEPLRIVAGDAVRDQAAPRSVVVLVIGETARSREFAFNGYARNTNPYLVGRDVINFSDTSSCGTSTAESLPCMFSHLGRDDYSQSKANRDENLLDILQRTGVKVVWRDNNSGSKGVADRVSYEDFSHRADLAFCSDDNCYDEVLLQGLDELIRSSPGDLLVVLHLQGSHGPAYYKRSPPAFKVFMPECTRDNVQDCPQQTIVNAYDNTIVYTDYVLSKLIDILQVQAANTAMLYVSDHGESLGENGIYLHGLPYYLAPAEQKQVPMIFWASDSFFSAQKIDRALISAKRTMPMSHDNLFHSILGLFHVHTGVYQAGLDIFAGSRSLQG